MYQLVNIPCATSAPPIFIHSPGKQMNKRYSPALLLEKKRSAAKLHNDASPYRAAPVRRARQPRKLQSLVLGRGGRAQRHITQATARANRCAKHHAHVYSRGCCCCCVAFKPTEAHQDTSARGAPHARERPELACARKPRACRVGVESATA